VVYPAFTRTFTYDLMGRVTQETDTFDSGISEIRTFSYDATGNLVTSSDEQGRTTSYEYDELGRLVSIVRPDQTRIIRTYDSRNNLIRLENPNQGIQYFTYDRNNRLAGITVPGQGQISYGYNTANWNNPVSMLFPGGSGQSYTHDPLMRLKTITGTDPGHNTLMSRGYEYSPAGNITQKQTALGGHPLKAGSPLIIGLCKCSVRGSGSCNQRRGLKKR